MKNSKTAKNTKTKNMKPATKVALPQSSSPQAGAERKYAGKELLARTDGTVKVVAIPLQPGLTSAAQLDVLAEVHAQFRFTKAPRLVVRSLTNPQSEGVWFTRVIHDASVAQVLDASSGVWDYRGPAFAAKRASEHFSVSVPTTQGYASAFTESFSWLLMVHEGPPSDQTEIWLEYEVVMRGISQRSKQSQLFRVKEGKFLDEEGKELGGVPVLTGGTKYTFSGEKLLTVDQARDFVARTPGVLTEVRRPKEKDPTVVSSGSVTEIVKNVAKTAGAELAHYGLGAIGSALRARGFRFPAMLTGTGQRAQSAFDSFTGYVLVEQEGARRASADFYESTPPIVLPAEKADATRAVGTVLRGLLELTFAMTAQAGLEAILAKLARQPVVVHKGLHALAFQAPRTIKDSVGGGGSGPEDNPLPDTPDFEEDVEAPGTILPWSAAQNFFQGYVVDDNGTPFIKWLGGRAPDGSASYFSVPSPSYYVNLRRPWDKETKRALACSIRISEFLQGHWLLLEGYTWGDDGVVSFHSNIPGTQYLGTVARCSGISESRSVVRITSYEQCNEFLEHLVIGQNKQKYMKNDYGRACLFFLRLGAVSREDVALAFLANWTIDPSATRLYNYPYTKSGGAQPATPFPTLADFDVQKARSRAKVELDAFAPGFAENYDALTSLAGTMARINELPVKIEAGPFRLIHLARWDDQNGWYQHVPDFAYTRTDITSNWSAKLMLDTTGYGGNPLKTLAASVAHPANLSAGAYVCIELVAVGGTVAATTARIRTTAATGNTEVDGQAATVTGPLTVMRYVLKADQITKWYVEVLGENSRPTTAVDGYTGDFYVAYTLKAYLVKNEKVAGQWGRGHYYAAIDEGWTGKNYAANTFRAEKGEEFWALNKSKWFQQYDYGTAPLVQSSSNPIYSPSGYARSVLAEKDFTSGTEETPMGDSNDLDVVETASLSEPPESGN